MASVTTSSWSSNHLLSSQTRTRTKTQTPVTERQLQTTTICLDDSTRLYWRRDGDVFSLLVAQGMRRDTFEHLLRVLHLADNSKMDSSKPDSYYKVRPVFEIANRNNKMLPPPEELFIDECMVPYYGHHSTKQFVRGSRCSSDSNSGVYAPQTATCFMQSLTVALLQS